VLDESGAETGMFEIPAGGRRFRALELLVKQKRLNKTAPVPCIVRTDGLAEEDSLAENVQRAPLHPLDQFRAFQAMRDKGRSEEEIAAAFFVAPGVVKQRLKLAAVSPVLLEAYAEEAMTLDQLMAFTVNPDPARQEQVWEALQRHYSKAALRDPAHADRGRGAGLGQAGAVRRARQLRRGGGAILRDLFQQDDGGWLQDARLLDLMVARAAGRGGRGGAGRGLEMGRGRTDFPYGHTLGPAAAARRGGADERRGEAAHAAAARGIRRARGRTCRCGRVARRRRYPAGRDREAMEALEARPLRFDPEEQARAGAFVSIDPSGRLRVERGYVRPEDEPRRSRNPRRWRPRLPPVMW
jgi:ParB family transcriptional regulator, chromosome partitioning protein